MSKLIIKNCPVEDGQLPLKIEATKHTLFNLSAKSTDNTDVTTYLIDADVLEIEQPSFEKEIVALDLCEEVARIVEYVLPDGYGPCYTDLSYDYNVSQGGKPLVIQPASSTRYWEDRDTVHDQFAIMITLNVPCEDEPEVAPAFGIFQDIESMLTGQVVYFGEDGDKAARFNHMVYNSPVKVNYAADLEGYYDSENLEQNIILTVSVLTFWDRWQVK